MRADRLAAQCGHRPERREFRGKEVTKEMAYFMTWLSATLRKEEGQGLAEYALILALIAVIAIAALVFLGTRISSILSQIGANI
jgi:pilus assembly protein Flp/PilA